MRWIKPAAALTVFVLLSASVVGAAADWNGYRTATVRVNGQQLQSDVPPIILEGRTLVPLRAVTEALGGSIAFDPDTYTVDLNVDTDGPTDEAYAEALYAVQVLREASELKDTEITRLETQVTSLYSTVTRLQAVNQELVAQVPSGPADWSLSKEQVKVAVAYGQQWPSGTYSNTMHPDYVYQLVHPSLGGRAYIGMELTTPWKRVADLAAYQQEIKSSPLSDEEWLLLGNEDKVSVVFSTMLGTDTIQRNVGVRLSLVQNGQSIHPYEYSSLNTVQGVDNFIWWSANFRASQLRRNIPITMIAVVEQEPAGAWHQKTFRVVWDLANLR